MKLSRDTHNDCRVYLISAICFNRGDIISIKKIDLDKQSMWIDNVILIDKGKPVNGYNMPDTAPDWSTLDRLYTEYKYSVPDGINHKLQYFQALPYEALSLTHLINNKPRSEAKFDLEFAVLMAAINHSLELPENHWFWQSQSDPDFVILRKWIDPSPLCKERMSQNDCCYA